MINLGKILTKDPDIPRDLVESYGWFRAAEKKGDANASQLLEDIKKSMTDEQLERAKRLERPRNR